MQPMKNNMSGLLTAVFTPLKKDGSLNLKQVSGVVEHLIQDGVAGVYVCGSTGEGPSLTDRERRTVAEAYVEAIGGRLPVIIHVGHNSLRQARELAGHAAEIGADAIAAVPPVYFKIRSAEILLQSFAEISAGAPGLPFFYYHIPLLTGMQIDLLSFLEKSENILPALAGIKYTAPTIFEFQSLLGFKEGKFTIFYGTDEMMSSALSVGAYGFIGTTYNFAAPLYRRLITAFRTGDSEAVAACQNLSVEMIRVCFRYGGLPAFKTVMRFIGLDCGPCRLPLQNLKKTEVSGLRKDLENIGFFRWGRK